MHMHEPPFTVTYNRTSSSRLPSLGAALETYFNAKRNGFKNLGILDGKGVDITDHVLGERQDRRWMSDGSSILRIDIECNEGTGARRIVGTQLSRNDEVRTSIEVPIPRFGLSSDDVGDLARQIAATLHTAWQKRDP